MGYQLAWTATLGAMLDYGPRLQIKTRCEPCDTWAGVDVIDWARQYGADFSFWDWIEPCPTCGRALTFLCSPSPSTPMLPMWTDGGRAAAFGHDDQALRTDEKPLAVSSEG